MKKNRRFTSVLNVVATALLFTLIQVLLGVFASNRSLESLMVQVCYNIIMVASLNLVTGVLGELTLGHAGFMSVGAYTSAILTSLVFPEGIGYFPLALIGGGLMAALFGYVIGIPALRYNCMVSLLVPPTICVNMLFQSIGLAGRGSFLAALRSGLCLLPVVLVLPNIIGLAGIQAAQPVADVFTFVITLPFAVQFLRQLKSEKNLPH